MDAENVIKANAYATILATTIPEPYFDSRILINANDATTDTIPTAAGINLGFAFNDYTS